MKSQVSTEKISKAHEKKVLSTRRAKYFYTFLGSLIPNPGCFDSVRLPFAHNLKKMNILFFYSRRTYAGVSVTSHPFLNNFSFQCPNVICKHIHISPSLIPTFHLLYVLIESSFMLLTLTPKFIVK